MMRHYEDHHQGLVMPEHWKVSAPEASKHFGARLHMTDARIRYQDQNPPIPAGNGLLSRWTWHILHESLQVRKFPEDGDANPAYVPR